MDQMDSHMSVDSLSSTTNNDDLDRPMVTVKSNTPTPVIFDLETTGLDASAEIIQLSAKYRHLEYNNYILPTHGIPTVVTAINHLSVINGELIKKNTNGHEEVMQTISEIDAYKNFISFLKLISNQIILVAHNGVRFDAPLILRAMSKNNLLNDFKSVVYGFVDSINVFKNLEELECRFIFGKSFKLTALAKDYLEAGFTVDAHNAIVDVQILDALLTKFSVSDERLVRFTVAVEKISVGGQKKNLKQEIVEEYSPFKGDIASSTICKLASAGIRLKDLTELLKSGGDSEVFKVLEEEIDGHPKVTKNRDIQLKLCNSIRLYINQQGAK